MIDQTIICENHFPSRHTRPAKSLQNDADIWLAKISSYVPRINDIIPVLSEDEVTKSEKYHRLKDTNSFIIRRGILRFLLAKYTLRQPGEIDFAVGTNKKPVLHGSRIPVHFNLSHSDDLVLIAFSNTEVGVDVEKINNDFNYHEILSHAFSPEEALFIESSSNPRKLFFKLWTRKEAILKATSKGLDDHIASIPCTDGSHIADAGLPGDNNTWTIRSFSPTESYEVSIAHKTGLHTRLIECNPEYLFNDY